MIVAVDSATGTPRRLTRRCILLRNTRRRKPPHPASPTGAYPVYATVTCVDTQVCNARRIISSPPTDNIASLRQDLSLYPSSTASNFFPCGEEQTSTPNDRVKFATYRRDSESNLDYAWNRYAYTLNDPIGANDPTGRDDAACDDGCSDAPYSDSGSTGGDGGTGGSSPTANYTSADLTSTQCYDPNTAAPAPCSSNSTGPMQTLGDPSTSNTITVTTSPTTPSANVGSPVTQTNLRASVPNLSITLPIPPLPFLGVQLEIAVIPSTKQTCGSLGLSLSPTLAIGVNVGFHFDPDQPAAKVLPGGSIRVTLQQSPGLGVQATGSLGSPVIAGPVLGASGVLPALATVGASVGKCSGGAN